MKGVAERAGGAVGGHVGFAMQAGKFLQYGSSCIVPSCSRQPPLAPRRNLAVINKVYLVVGKDVVATTQRKLPSQLRWISFFVLLALGGLLLARCLH